MANTQSDPASSGFDDSECDRFFIFWQTITFDWSVQNATFVRSGFTSDQMIIIINDEIGMFGLVIELESIIWEVELNVFEGWQIFDDSVFIKTHNTRVKSIIMFVLNFELIILFLSILK